MFDYFEPDEYERVMAAHPSTEEMDNAAATEKVGHSCMLQYRASVVGLHINQRSVGASGISTASLKSERVDELLKVVKERRAVERLVNNDERVDGSLNPYLLIEKVPLIEEELFSKKPRNEGGIAACMRNRFHFLLTLSGILRSESLDKADLSDFSTFKAKAEGEPHPYEVLILTFTQGKTVKAGTVQRGRVLRHREVEMCPFGAFGLYLFARFSITGELKWIDFTRNEAWFNIKTMIDFKDPSNKRLADVQQPVDKNAYTSEIKKVSRKLQLPNKHFRHLGRAIGPRVLEIEEVDAAEINKMGNWSMTTQTSFYSNSLPFQAMRVAAGYAKSTGLHYNPRTLLEPPRRSATIDFS